MPRKLQDSVVVITGASSGIGRATALAFARTGATVVVAARREQALRDVAAECERLGVRAQAVPMDVTDHAAVQALAQTARQTFGRIDVWVNNAAVGLFGRFTETPLEDYRRVIETDVFGYIYGARAALPIFYEQGGGVLINVSSIVGVVPQPYTSPYVMSKAAVRMLGMSLRQELILEGTKNIHVCTVMPATIDTPFFQHAANYTHRAAKAMPPVYAAERVAKTIVNLAEHPKREVMVGNAGRMLNLIRTIAPALGERQMATQVDKTHLYQNKPAPPTSGNLWEPMPEYASVSGSWQVGGGERTRRIATIAGALAVPALLLWRRRWQHTQRQTMAEQLAKRGAETLGPARKFLPIGQQDGKDGLIPRAMKTLGAATKVVPRRRQSRWSRIAQWVVG